MAPQDEEFLTQVEGIDLFIAEETRRILTEWVGIDPELTPEAAQEQINREALRLQKLTEEAAEDFERATPPTTGSTYWDAVQTKESAWRAARETVLEQELYPQVTPEMRAERAEFDAQIEREIETQQDAARKTQDPDRWRSLNVRPMPAAERVVERVWLAKGPRFRSLARALVAQRIEDDQPVPMTGRDPIADELAQMIDDEIRRTPEIDPELPF